MRGLAFILAMIAAGAAFTAEPGPAPGRVSLLRVFAREKLHRPVHLAHVPDGSKRIAVVEQAGVVKWFNPGSEAAEGEMIDLRGVVSTSHNEEGLLSIAFHPSFATHRQFFLYYSAAMPRRSMIVRYTAERASLVADKDSAFVLMQIPQPYGNHNGGQLAFGPDGYLYAGLGDGGSAGDPQGNGQNKATLLGAILRIDADHPGNGLAYGVPSDNPFVGANDGSRAEIWAYGLRNPWRFSFDRATGALFAGDVGQDRMEEIDRIEKGGNYGWNVMEATLCFSPANNCDRAGLIPPVAAYDRGQGISVTGGFVYRGMAIPELVGSYLYGDFGSGRIWTIPAGTRGLAAPRLLIDTQARTRLYIASFGEDADGELYVLDLNGAVYRLVSTP